MTIIGRITKNAEVHAVKEDKQVVNFTLAVNEYYKPKGKEGVKLTTFINCGYWRNATLSRFLLKGALVEVEGRIEATAFVTKEGEAKASLNCHVNKIKLHGGGKKTLSKEALNSKEATVISDVEVITEETPF